MPHDEAEFDDDGHAIKYMSASDVIDDEDGEKEGEEDLNEFDGYPMKPAVGSPFKYKCNY